MNGIRFYRNKNRLAICELSQLAQVSAPVIRSLEKRSSPIPLCLSICVSQTLSASRWTSCWMITIRHSLRMVTGTPTLGLSLNPHAIPLPSIDATKTCPFSSSPIDLASLHVNGRAAYATVRAYGPSICSFLLRTRA